MRCGRVRLTLFFPLHNSNFLYRIENVVCYPFRTANLVDNGTKEGQIGEGCQVGRDGYTVHSMSIQVSIYLHAFQPLGREECVEILDHIVVAPLKPVQGLFAAAQLKNF